MTDKDIIEYILLCSKILNRKIWMVKYYDNDTQSDLKEVKVLEYKKYLKDGYILNICSRPYHTDWNLIHDVIGKIKYDYVPTYLNGISSIVPCIEMKRPISKALLDNDKESVVYNLYVYLIWWNENRK